MIRTGKVRLCVCLALVAGLLVAGAPQAGGLDEGDGLHLGIGFGPQIVPGPLLAVAHWALLSSFSLPPQPSDVPTTTAYPAPDRSEGGPVEVGGDSWERYEYLDAFREPWYREDATIEGLSSVHWDPRAATLELDGSPGRRPVVLLYRFVAPYVMKDLVAELEGEIEGAGGDRVELALSVDGKSFGHAVGAFGSEGGNRFLLTTNASTEYHRCGFWVRIVGELSPEARVRLTSFRMAGRVKPPGVPQVALEHSGGDRLHYRDDFRSRKLFHLAEVQNPDALCWRRGRVFVRGGEAPVLVEVRQKFQSPEPLQAIAVRVRNAANGEGRNEFAISLDGRNLLAVATTPTSTGSFDGTTELRLDDPRLANAREFYLHMRLASDAAQTVSSLSSVEVEAVAAPGAIATAAASAEGAAAHD